MTARDNLTWYLHRDDVTVWLELFSSRLVPTGTDLPMYGSQEWLQAPDNVRLASALRAGEAWRRDGLYAGQRLADKLAADRYARDCEEAARFAEVGAFVRRMADWPTWDELQQRRAVVVRPGVAA